jgi:guanylate kinase
MVRDREFLEHAEVFGNCYGTARRFLQEAQAKGTTYFSISMSRERSRSSRPFPMR